MDPVSCYGVAPEFLRKSDHPDRNKSSGDLLLKPSKRRGTSSGKRRRKSGSDNRLSPSPTQQNPTSSSGIISDDPIDISDNTLESVHSTRADETSVVLISAIPEESAIDSSKDEQSNVHGEKFSEMCSDDNKGADDMDHEGVNTGPSFLSRVSGPLGSDLLTLLNTPAKNVSGTDISDNNGNTEVVKSFFVSDDAVSPAAGSVDAKDTVVVSSKTEDLMMTESSISNDGPMLLKSMSMESSSGGNRNERSGSFVPSTATRCPGCDACRGRVCRPRLAGDFVTIMTPVRFISTSYAAANNRAGAISSPSTGVNPLSGPTACNRSAAQLSGEGCNPAVSEDKNKSVFWHQNMAFAVPFRRTIRLLAMLSSAVCPRVSNIYCHGNTICEYILL